MAVFNIQTTTRFQEMINMCGDTKNKVILELGAGRYVITSWIRDFKKRITMDAVGRPTIKCDLTEGIKLEDNSVDIVIAGELIEHLPNAEEFLKEVRRVLKPKGLFILSVPNCCSLVIRIKMLLGILDGVFCVPEFREKFKWERHMKDFNKKVLIDFLDKGGFNIEKMSTEGIITHSTRVFPLKLTPVSFGGSLIVKARLKDEGNR